MSVFGYHDIDPLFETLNKRSQDTILSLANNQAFSFVPALRASAKEFIAKEAPATLPRELPEDTDLLEESDFNYALSAAHPAALQSLFVMGFIQGFCLAHRLDSLDTDMFESLDTAYAASDENEEAEEDEEDLAVSSPGDIQVEENPQPSKTENEATNG